MPQPASRIRVLVVDDEPMVCSHLDTILSVASDIEVLEPAYDGAAAVEMVIRQRPELVLMDLRMPGVDGLTAIDRIRKLATPPVVVALTTFHADELVVRALQMGAAGFLVKSTPPEDFVGLIRVAAAGHTVLSPAATRGLLASAARDREFLDLPRKRAAALSERESEVLGCIANGMSNAQIASKLYLSEATVKGYVSRLLDKLDCANRAQAAVLAYRLGLPPRP
ncbi:MAG: response regulator transcription factor [Streptosporangiaceae bacterium]|nr:response regulator transcription factor [Streptosporangiaceae bacterium]